MSWLVRLLGRRFNKTDSVYSDQPVRVEQTYFNVGMLEAHLLLQSYQTGVTLMRTAWFMHAGGATSSPLILKKLEVCNRLGGRSASAWGSWQRLTARRGRIMPFWPGIPRSLPVRCGGGKGRYRCRGGIFMLRREGWG